MRSSRRNIEEPLMLLLWVDGAWERPLSHSDFTWPLLSSWGAKVWLGRCVQRQWLREALCSVWMAFRACFKMLELVGKGVVGGSKIIQSSVEWKCWFSWFFNSHPPILRGFWWFWVLSIEVTTWCHDVPRHVGELMWVIAIARHQQDMIQNR